MCRVAQDLYAQNPWLIHCVHSTAHGLVSDPDLAEEVKQTAHADIARGCHTYDSSRGRLKPWVRSIVKHAAYRELGGRAKAAYETRGNALEPDQPLSATLPDPCPLDPAAQLELEELDAFVDTLLDLLGEYESDLNYIAVFICRYVYDDSVAEIAAAFGLKENTIRCYCLRSIKWLRRKLGGDDFQLLS